MNRLTCTHDSKQRSVEANIIKPSFKLYTCAGGEESTGPLTLDESTPVAACNVFLYTLIPFQILRNR